MPLDFYVLCPNPECPFHEDPIPLLVANPEQRRNDLDAWPNDGCALHLLCPGCRIVSAHSHADLETRPEDSRNRFEEWIRVTLVCGEGDCKTLARFHARVAKLGDYAIRHEAEQKVRFGYWKGNFPCSHPFSGASHLVVERVNFWA